MIRRDCHGAAADKFFVVTYEDGEYVRDTMFGNVREAVVWWEVVEGSLIWNASHGTFYIVSVGVPARFLTEVPWQVTDA